MEIIVAYPDADLIQFYQSPRLDRISCTLDISTISPSDLEVSSNFVYQFIPFLGSSNYVLRITELSLMLLIPPEMFWLTHRDQRVQVDKQRSYISSIIGSLTDFPNLQRLNLCLKYPDETVPTPQDMSSLNSKFSCSSHEDTDVCSDVEPQPYSNPYNRKPHQTFSIGNLCHRNITKVRLRFPTSMQVAFVFNVVHVPRCFSFATNLLPPCNFEQCSVRNLSCCRFFNPDNASFIVGGLTFSVAYANGGNIQSMMKDSRYPFSCGKFKVHHGYFREFTSNNSAVHDIVIRCGSTPFLFYELSRDMIRGWEDDEF